MVHDHHVQKHQRKNHEISEEGRIALRGKDSPKREVGDETYALEQTLEPIKYVV
jgi:hypothetical protein